MSCIASHTYASDCHLSCDLHPICTFGVITDIHYADADNDMNYEKTKVRNYRRSLEFVETAVSCWSAADKKINFLLQLGDLIDGRNAGFGTSDKALSVVREQLDKLQLPMYHVVGNHELYNFSRAKLLIIDWLNPTSIHYRPDVVTPTPGSTAYYHFSPAKGFRIVILDQYELSLLGRDKESELYRLAEEILTTHNKNKELNSPDGLRGDFRRFVKFNGATSSDQLNWLNGVLETAQMDGELVLVAGHLPISANVSDYLCMCWNYKEILQVLHRFPCVLAYFAGHTHDFAHGRDSAGLYHVVFPGVIETLTRHAASHATVSVYADGFVISSQNSVMPDVIEIRKTHRSSQQC